MGTLSDSREKRLAELISAYQGTLLNACYMYLGDREQARDAVQEVFLKVYRGMDAFRGDSGEKTWLLKIARNTCLDMRRSAYFRHVDRRVTPETLPETAEKNASEDERELTAAILSLPEKLKDAVLLYYYQSLSMAETAEILRVTQSSVSSRLKRARKRLKAVLERGGAI